MARLHMSFFGKSIKKETHIKTTISLSITDREIVQSYKVTLRKTSIYLSITDSKRVIFALETTTFVQSAHQVSFL